MEETSLEDFLDADGTSEGGSDGEAAFGAETRSRGGDGERETAAETDAGAGEGPPVTATWSPAGEPCGACGATVHRRWAAATLLCGDCKEW